MSTNAMNCLLFKTPHSCVCLKINWNHYLRKSTWAPKQKGFTSVLDLMRKNKPLRSDHLSRVFMPKAFISQMDKNITVSGVFRCTLSSCPSTYIDMSRAWLTWDAGAWRFQGPDWINDFLSRSCVISSRQISWMSRLSRSSSSPTGSRTSTAWERRRTAWLNISLINTPWPKRVKLPLTILPHTSECSSELPVPVAYSTSHLQKQKPSSQMLFPLHSRLHSDI